MALSRIVRGCDFSMEIAVFTPEYIDGHTQWIDFNILTCSNIAVNLICTKDQVVIPLSWRIKDDSDHVIIADVQGKWLHSGAVYALEITGLDENEKAWRFKNKSIFSVVDATSQAVLDAELMADPLEVNATIGLAAYIEPVVGPQGPQGEKGNDGLIGKDGEQGPQGPIGEQGPQGTQGVEGYVPSNTILGYQAGAAVSGIKIDIVQSLPASPDANTLYIVM